MNFPCWDENWPSSVQSKYLKHSSRVAMTMIGRLSSTRWYGYSFHLNPTAPPAHGVRNILPSRRRPAGLTDHSHVARARRYQIQDCPQPPIHGLPSSISLTRRWMVHAPCSMNWLRRSKSLTFSLTLLLGCLSSWTVSNSLMDNVCFSNRMEELYSEFDIVGDLLLS
jgi:hypothetical protein